MQVNPTRICMPLVYTVPTSPRLLTRWEMWPKVLHAHLEATSTRFLSKRLFGQISQTRSVQLRVFCFHNGHAIGEKLACPNA